MLKPKHHLFQVCTLFSPNTMTSLTSLSISITVGFITKQLRGLLQNSCSAKSPKTPSGKHMWRNSILVKMQALDLRLFSIRNPSQGFFVGILSDFWGQIFLQYHHTKSVINKNHVKELLLYTVAISLNSTCTPC